MSKDHLEPDLMHYDALAQEALRGVVKAALKQAASPEGIPGGHHFYITFRTRAPGVSIPPELQERYPEEMTIVLQHQFWDLGPGETFFTVTCSSAASPSGSRSPTRPSAASTTRMCSSCCRSRRPTRRPPSWRPCP
jgi:uncharacterized protein